MWHYVMTTYPSYITVILYQNLESLLKREQKKSKACSLKAPLRIDQMLYASFVTSLIHEKNPIAGLKLNFLPSNTWKPKEVLLVPHLLLDDITSNICLATSCQIQTDIPTFVSLITFHSFRHLPGDRTQPYYPTMFLHCRLGQNH